METHCLSGIVSGDAVYLTFKDNGHSAGQEGFLGPERDQRAGACCRALGVRRAGLPAWELCDREQLIPSVRPHVHPANPAFTSQREAGRWQGVFTGVHSVTARVSRGMCSTLGGSCHRDTAPACWV